MDRPVSKAERFLGLAALVSILAFNMWYTGHAIDKSQERQCELINAQVSVYDETAPTTPAGLRLAETYRTLKAEHHC